jgi:hypothetical protein
MKHLILSFLLALSFQGKIFAQTLHPEEIQQFESLNSDPYVKALSACKLKSFCSENVLLVFTKRNSEVSKYMDPLKIDEFLAKKYDIKKYKIKLSAETNNGYVIVVGQYCPQEEVAIRYFTFEVDPLNRKITSITIQENK